MLNDIATKVNGKLNQPEAGDHSITVPSSDLFKACQSLKADGFNVLHVISTIDYPEKNIIELSYMLSDYNDNRDLILKTEVPREGGKVDSVSSIWKAADWQERKLST